MRQRKKPMRVCLGCGQVKEKAICFGSSYLQMVRFILIQQGRRQGEELMWKLLKIAY